MKISILIDIGELIIGSENIEKQIMGRPWSYYYVINAAPQKPRDYFINEMDKNFLKKRK